MATLQDIKLRITSVTSTQKITKAMKMVAAAKMKRAENRIKAARPYTDKLKGMVANLSAGIDPTAHPLLTKNEDSKAVIVLITSDKGLCGGLNSKLCKNLSQFVSRKSKDIDSVEIVPVGKKGFEFFRNEDVTLAEAIKELKDTEMEKATQSLLGKLIKQYENGEISQLWIAYNHYKNVITQEQTIDQILPIEAPEEDATASDDQAEFLLEPDQVEILSSLLPQYVENQAYTALLDNFACEHASRMMAMDSATKNAGELIDSLTLQYNRARQAAITTELIEIISGAESL